jgi:hypothetical protein
MLFNISAMGNEGTHQQYFSPPLPQATFACCTSYQPISYDHQNGGKRHRDREINHQASPSQATQEGGNLPPCPATNAGNSASSPHRNEESSVKRARYNTYKEPRTVPPSILTATGSLAVGMLTGMAVSQGPRVYPSVIPFRRQVSSGALDSYLGGNDGMDLETNDQSRPRSMSF